MAHLLVVILHDLTRLPALLAAWKKIGVPGVTLVNSVGGFHAENFLEKIGLGGLGRLFDQEEIRQRTLLSVIADHDLLELAISEADEVIEGFDRPHSGILFALPINHVLGLRKSRPMPASVPGFSEGVLEAASGGLINRKMPVSEIVKVLEFEPITVTTVTALPDIVTQMIAYPHVHMVCVVNDERRLMGLIDLTTLADGFFFSIFPEKFLSELNDLDKVLDFAERTGARLASDLMQDPVWVKMDDSLEKAFELMHKHKLPGLPVIDDHYHVLAYINLLELMGVCLQGAAGLEGDE